MEIRISAMELKNVLKKHYGIKKSLSMTELWHRNSGIIYDDGENNIKSDYIRVKFERLK